MRDENNIHFLKIADCSFKKSDVHSYFFLICIA